MATTASTTSSRKAPAAPTKMAPVKPKTNRALKETAESNPRPVKSKSTSMAPPPKPRPAAEKAAPKSPAIAAKIAEAKKVGVSITPEERHRMICDAAYYRAERRGFKGGDPRQDWLDAEYEIDQLLMQRS